MTYTDRVPRILAIPLILILAATSIMCVAHSPQGGIGGQEDSGDIQIEEAMVEMDDGVRLATTVYLPSGEGPWPAILTRTPYGRESEHEWGLRLAEYGFAFVLQDIRGCHDSEGKGAAFFTGREDGQATLEWIAAQPWSNERVMTLGGSATGITQYVLAPGASDVLRCQWIEVATPDLYDGAVYQGGVYRETLAPGWLESVGSAHRIEPFMSHYLNDEYWDVGQIDDYSQVTVPAFHTAGWYDIFARPTVQGFLGYQNEGGEGAKGAQHLIMGPWAHELHNPQVGELTIPSTELATYEEHFNALALACLFDDPEAQAHLDALPSVQYFTIGAIGEANAPGNEWHTAETWPPPGGVDTPLYLHTGNTLSRNLPAADDVGDTFTYDPANPSPTVGGANSGLLYGSYDQREVEAREDVVVYTTPPLENPVEATGDLRAEIWITTEVPDTDIAVRLTDVYPDGRSMLVSDGIFRARYRNCPDFTCEEFLEPGEPVQLTIDLGPHSYIFNTGHSIRISVTSSNAPRFAPNPNTGEMFLGEGDTGRIAHTTILHDADHPSALVLPVVE